MLFKRLFQFLYLHLCCSKVFHFWPKSNEHTCINLCINLDKKTIPVISHSFNSKSFVIGWKIAFTYFNVPLLFKMLLTEPKSGSAEVGKRGPFLTGQSLKIWTFFLSQIKISSFWFNVAQFLKFWTILLKTGR